MNLYPYPRSAALPLTVSLASVLLGCPMVGKLPRDPRALGGGGVNADACGEYKLSDAGRKIHAFLSATSELEKAVKNLSDTAKHACAAMARELGIPEEGKTKDLCGRVAQGLRNNLKVGLRPGAGFVVKAKPAVCTVDVAAAARVSAECRGSAQASASVVCEGRCEGTCRGECAGTCGARSSGGQCQGACDGTCRGECSGSCRGSVSADGEAECRAAAEIKANAHVTCTEPEIEVSYEGPAVVDVSRIEKVKKAIQVGLPKLLSVEARAKTAAKAVATWAKTAQGLHSAGQDIVSGLGDASLCVWGQIGAAMEAVGNVQVEIQVTVEVSAEVGGACQTG